MSNKNKKLTKDDTIKIQKANLEAQGKIIASLREKIKAYHLWLFYSLPRVYEQDGTEGNIVMKASQQHFTKLFGELPLEINLEESSMLQPADFPLAIARAQLLLKAVASERNLKVFIAVSAKPRLWSELIVDLQINPKSLRDALKKLVVHKLVICGVNGYTITPFGLKLLDLLNRMYEIKKASAHEVH